MISPQPWGPLHISKHHYALALLDEGYEVYFLNAPGDIKKTVITQPYNDRALFVIDSGFFNSLVLRYHFRYVYDWLVKRWLKQLLQLLPTPDLVWCFDTNTIRNLDVLGKSKKIFHVVDPIDPRMIATASQADLIVCVSDKILQQFQLVNKPKQFINHGLSEQAIAQALQIDIGSYGAPAQRKVGFVGNLFRMSIETELVVQIVTENPEIEFHFYGPYVSSANPLGGEGNSLAHHLSNYPNVILHGPVASEQIVKEISSLDAFLLPYKTIPGFYDSSNSHKILEYWATGKVVVSTYIDQYTSPQFSDYMAMTAESENNALPALFKKVMDNLETWNSFSLMNKRRDYALRHSYRNNTKQILALV